MTFSAIFVLPHINISHTKIVYYEYFLEVAADENFLWRPLAVWFLYTMQRSLLLSFIVVLNPAFIHRGEFLAQTNKC